MGSRMARRLLDAGHELIVWNRSRARAEPLAALGAAEAESPADATQRAEAVIVMVSAPDALRAVIEGADGVAESATESTPVIQMSTVGPRPVERLAEVLPAGTGLLDAPVLGSIDEAEAGALTVFVGGPEPLVERWRPLLSVLGSVVHVGPLGAGSSAKLVANSSLFGAIGVLGEALALAQALGLSREAAFEVLAVTPLASQAERRRPAIESGEYPARFSVSLALKDADLMLAAAERAGIDLRLLPAARTWLAEAAREDGDQDYAAVLARILRR